MQKDTILATLQQMVEPLKEGLMHDSEVVLHDLTKLPNSIVAIAGSLTGRKVGGPATDLLLSKVAEGRLESEAGYQSRLPDGRLLRSTTIVVRDDAGVPVAALCFNSDVSMWFEIEAVAARVLGRATRLPEAVQAPAPAELYFKDLDEAADQLLARVVEEVGVPVDLMRKQHKVEVVRLLKARGFFSLREAVERAAEELRVSRFSVYNYLNEIEEAEQLPEEAVEA